MSKTKKNRSEQRVKKNSKLKILFSRLSFKKLNSEIRAYGYSYNLKSFLLQMLAYLILVVGAGYFYLLKPVSMIILIVTAILVFPIIVLAQFRHMYNNQRFENLVNYMEKMIIFFKQQPKIIRCVEKTRMYVDDKTKDRIDEAIEVLNFDMSNERYSKALKIIENEYHSSRLVSLHRFMITVEEKSSKEYITSLNNLDYDLKEWVNRVYDYQTQLKTKKAQVMVSLIASILLLAIFSVMWMEVDDITNMISNPIYQIGATAFLMTSLILFTIAQTKINGQWLVEDYTGDVDYKTLRKIDLVNNYNYKNSLKKQIPKIMLFGILCGYCAYMKQYSFAVFLALIIGYLFYEPTKMQKMRIKSIGQTISTEFPLWLRDVALNLNNYVVVGAIRNSMNFASETLKPFLVKLLNDIDENPTSIEPFTSFLAQYKVHDITTSMLALYSLQQVSSIDSEREITDIIKRNQTMLSNAEKIRNQNALIGIIVVSFVPVFFTMAKIMVDMVIMLLGIFSNMNLG